MVDRHLADHAARHLAAVGCAQAALDILHDLVDRTLRQGAFAGAEVDAAAQLLALELLAAAVALDHHDRRALHVFVRVEAVMATAALTPSVDARVGGAGVDDTGGVLATSGTVHGYWGPLWGGLVMAITTARRPSGGQRLPSTECCELVQARCERAAPDRPTREPRRATAARAPRRLSTPVRERVRPRSVRGGHLSTADRFERRKVFVGGDSWPSPPCVLRQRGVALRLASARGRCDAGTSADPPR